MHWLSWYVFCQINTLSLGKVVLEKLLRSVECKKIYLLIRPKSEIFESLRLQHEDFMAYVDEKIIGVEGDISEPNVIFNKDKLAEIIENVEVIINNAASIDFDLRLDQAIQINYMGPRRLGYIDEKIYNYPGDPDEIVNKLLSLSEHEILSQQKELIKPWVNTYTFTKNLSERSLQKHRGDMPLLILRPAIIISAYEQPQPGWIDSLAAAGALTLFATIGALQFVPSNKNNRGDMIPVDFVSNSVLVGTAFQANRNSLQIQHCATSHQNPILWVDYVIHVLDYARKKPMENIIGNIQCKFVPEKTYYRMKYLKTTLPTKALTYISQYGGSQTFKKNVQRLNKLNDKVSQVVELLKEFTLNDWCFESKRVLEIHQQLDEADKVNWNFNPKTIDWPLMSHLMVYGIQKFMMKMDVALPHEQQNLLQKVNTRYFEDAAQFYSKTNKVKGVNLDKLIDKVMFCDRVQNQLRIQCQGNTSNSTYHSLMKEGKLILRSMSAQIDKNTIKAVFMGFHTRFKRIFDQIIVSDAELKNISNLQAQKGNAVVLIPSFKSYLDFILLIYTHIIYEIDLPFICGMAEFEDVAILSKILKRCGGFFVNYKKLDQALPKVLLEEFLSHILKDQQILGYHLERKRERSGKIIKPLPFIFEQIVDTYMRSPDDIQDIILQPVTINYDKIYEGESFPYELLGDEGNRESVFKILKSILWVSEKYGRAYIKYCKPISLKEKVNEYIKQKGIDPRLLLNRQLGPVPVEVQNQVAILKSNFADTMSMELAYTLTDNLVVMSTQIVASVIISKRQGGITEDELVSKTLWLYEEIQLRGGVTCQSSKPNKQSIKNSLTYLKSFIDTKKDVFSPSVKANKDYKNILMLAYYRNGLIQLFLNEAYISASLLAFGESTVDSQGVPLNRLWDQTEFLTNILRDEFVVRNQINDFESFMEVLRFMEKRGYIQITGDAQPHIKVIREGKQALKFFRTFISPFVESYWVTLSYFRQMRPATPILQQDIEKRIQWLAETLHDEGFLMYYESCSLESIGNSVQHYSNMGVLKRIGEPFSLNNQKPEIYFQMSENKVEQNTLKEIYERLTFFKPQLTLITGIINFEDDVKRILTKAPIEHTFKL
ncbi:male sterility protein [Stylonychia lemnae]|uniref:Male sterility protein n=1 Tax=Stylonychia lemnae TaxID=5949 RepID=A0A078B5T8_STYLE|nr:male sterility protein [Stylonychia lemnae]|eukprot:CDW88677.1 male sterility protein [Stylonychia lemnae]